VAWFTERLSRCTKIVLEANIVGQMLNRT